MHVASQYTLTGHTRVLCCSVGIIYVAELVHWKTTPICWWLAQTPSSPSIDRNWPGYDFPGAESTLLGNVPGSWNTRWNQFLVMNCGSWISKMWWVSFSPSLNHFDSRMGQGSIIFSMCIYCLIDGCKLQVWIYNGIRRWNTVRNSEVDLAFSKYH